MIDLRAKISDTSAAETDAIQRAQTSRGDVVQSHQEVIAGEPMDRIEAMMLAAPQVDCPVYHHFGPGIYMREVFLPAGILAMGHSQKEEHMNILLKGKMAVIVNGEAKTIEGPYIFTGEPGRKFGYIIEDAVLVNVYATEETDIKKLEEMYVSTSDAWRAAQDRAENERAIDDAVRKCLEGAA